LDFSPKIDKDFPKLVGLWAFAFTKAIGMVNEKIDAHRISKAFGDSTAILISWPSPAQVIALMPSRPKQAYISHDPRHHESEGGSALSQMSKALCDLTEGIITKEEFDKLMEEYES
jgi:hypothetical protein